METESKHFHFVTRFQNSGQSTDLLYRSVLTGSYNNDFHIYDFEGKNDVTLQADKSAFRARRLGSSKSRMTRKSGRSDFGTDYIDFNKKILHSSWHPHENTVAVAATNNLFIFA